MITICQHRNPFGIPQNIYKCIWFATHSNLRPNHKIFLKRGQQYKSATHQRRGHISWNILLPGLLQFSVLWNLFQIQISRNYFCPNRVQNLHSAVLVQIFRMIRYLILILWTPMCSNNFDSLEYRIFPRTWVLYKRQEALRGRKPPPRLVWCAWNSLIRQKTV